jgi:hypothetical protein
MRRNVSAMVNIADDHSTASRNATVTTNPPAPQREVISHRPAANSGVIQTAGDRRTSAFAATAQEGARSATAARYVLAGSQAPMARTHIRVLLRQIGVDGVNLDLLAIQLAAALDGPLLMH